MPKYLLHTYHSTIPMVPLEMSGKTQPLDAISAAHHYVDTGQADYVEVFSVGFTGVARLLGTAGIKPTE